MSRPPFFRSRICVLAAFLLTVFPAFADDTETVRVRGEYWFSPNSEESPKSAFFQAYNDARKRAVAHVCGDHIRSLETLTTSSAGGQKYSGAISIDSVGVIKNVKEIRRGWKFPKAGEAEFYECPVVFYEAEISVKQSREQPDASFYAEVKGGKSVYKHGERADFRIISSKDAYLTVLWVNDNFEADVALSQKFLKADVLVKLEDLDESLESFGFEISSAKAKREAGTVFFVLTKRPYKFLKTENSENPEKNCEHLDRWMASIPLQERCIYALPFTIER